MQYALRKCDELCRASADLPMNSHWITSLPLVSISYALSLVGCMVWASRKKDDRLLWPLSGIIFSIATFNAYSESWPTLKQLRFEFAVPILMVLFVPLYRLFCLRLIERTGLRPRLAKEQYSFLVVIYAGAIAMMVLSGTFAKDENPPFVLFTFVMFFCALHVPAFAAARSKVRKFAATSGVVLSEAPQDISRSFFAMVVVILGIPLLVALIIQVAVHDDYRLFTVDVFLTIIIIILLCIYNKDNSKNSSQARGNKGKQGDGNKGTNETFTE